MTDEQFKEAISWFRTSIRYQGDRADVPARIQETPQRGPSSRLRWVVATVGLLALGAIPYERSRQQQRAAELAIEDAILLQRVNTAISRTVPRSMEPLMRLGETR